MIPPAAAVLLWGVLQPGHSGCALGQTTVSIPKAQEQKGRTHTNTERVPGAPGTGSREEAAKREDVEWGVGPGGGSTHSRGGRSLERRLLQSMPAQGLCALTPAHQACRPAAPLPMTSVHLPPGSQGCGLSRSSSRHLPSIVFADLLQLGVHVLASLPYNCSGEMAAVPFRFGSSLGANVGKGGKLGAAAPSLQPGCALRAPSPVAPVPGAWEGPASVASAAPGWSCSGLGLRDGWWVFHLGRPGRAPASPRAPSRGSEQRGGREPEPPLSPVPSEQGLDTAVSFLMQELKGTCSGLAPAHKQDMGPQWSG